MSKKEKTEKNPKGAGRKQKYDESTDMLCVRAPVSKIPEIREEIKVILEKYEIKDGTED